MNLPSKKFGTLVATEEFPVGIAFQPKARSLLPVIKEATLPNGIKIISNESSSPVHMKDKNYCSIN